jgi:hypothetical protein
MAPGDTFQGRRLPDTDEDPGFAEGDYCKVRGVWNVRPPGSHLGELHPDHQVTEHEDGTITVSPSILRRGGPGMVDEWHGYLEHGIWREV